MSTITPTGKEPNMGLHMPALTRRLLLAVAELAGEMAYWASVLREHLEQIETRAIQRARR